MERAPRWWDRPELERRLDGALTHRLTTITAAAGYGKTALLEQWTASIGGVGHRARAEDRDLALFARHVIGALRLRVPDLPREFTTILAGPLGPAAVSDASTRAAGLAGALGEALHGALRRDLALVIDDVDAIPADSPSVAFLDALLHSAPFRLHLVVASRGPPPFSIDRLRAQQQVFELTADDLSVSTTEVRRWIAAVTGDDEVLADRVTAHTGGWPIAVVSLVEELTELGPSGDRLSALERSAASPVFEELVRDAFDTLAPPVRELLLVATAVPRISPDLATAVGLPGDALADVHLSGLLLGRDPEVPGSYVATPSAVAAFGRAAVDDAATAERIRLASRWFLDEGEPALALHTLSTLGDPAAIADLLADLGDQLATGSAAASVVAVLDGPASALAATVAGRRLAGLAHHTTGAWERARVLLTEVADAGAMDAMIGWRLGLIHHLRGDLDEALEVYRQGRNTQPDADAAICGAYEATVLWLRGERELCAAAADDALGRAIELEDDRALAASHTVLAMLAALDGERRANDAHYLRAVEHAERAGDAFQLIRIRVNRASHHLEEGAYLDALAELETAARLAELTGFSPFTAVALSNRAEALVHLGRLEEAAVDAADAVATWRALGSRLVVYGLEQVATVRRLRGDRAGAAAAYDEVIDAAAAADDAQGLVAALAASAALLSEDDPEEALARAQRAVARGTGMGYVEACLATTHAALASGDRILAREHLELARAAAVTRRDRPGLAAASELRARLDRDEQEALRAVEAWQEIGDPIARAGAELTVIEIRTAAHPDDVDHRGVDERVAAVAAELHAIGCRVFDRRIEALRGSDGVDGDVVVRIRTLGGFSVLVDGKPVAPTQWQSRKARLLLKLLASRRGRPTARGWLTEQLWPDVDAEVANRRLRVLVSTLRGVLDPGHQHPNHHLVVTDNDTVRLDLRHVELDVVRLLDEVEVAARLDTRNRHAAALDRWRAAETAYTGEFCPEERYADWSVRTREELRAAYVQACARVATAAATEGDHDEAVRRWLRLLETDPYDERAHVALVGVLLAAGRRSEARRRYRSYTVRMQELGLEAVPFPGS